MIPAILHYVTPASEIDLLEMRALSLASMPEWPSVCSAGHNLLLEGPTTSMKDALRLLQPHLRDPVAWTRAGKMFALGATGSGTLILQDVDALTPDDQAFLRAWLAAPGRHPQVICTTQQALYPLVTLGRFDARLYYCLNTVLLQVE